MKDRNQFDENKEKKEKKRKAFFAQTDENKKSHPMTALEMKNLSTLYNNKYKINIMMNGDTDSGKRIIEEKIKDEIDSINFETHHDQLESFLKSSIGAYDEDKNNSTTFDIKEIINEFKILHATYSQLAIECATFFESYPKQIDKIINFLDKTDDESLSLIMEKQSGFLAWLKKLKDIIEMYQSLLNSGEKSQKFKDDIAGFEIMRQERLCDLALTRQESIHEINEIRKNLKDDEMIGYIYTNNHLIKKGHFDVIIITRDLLIKPCEWYVDEEKTISSNEIDNLSCLEMIPPLVSHENDQCYLPCSQAGSVECGTLGILYLKELLKNNSDQLKNFTMNIPFYDAQEKLHYFFIPSPEVLRYSQSGTFNKIILAMFEDQYDPVRIPFTQKGMNDTAIVETLVSTLENTMKIAEKKGDIKTIETCQDVLNKLPEFRTKWLKSYESAISKRISMQDVSLNAYLAYSSQRLRDKVAEDTQKEMQDRNLTKKINK